MKRLRLKESTCLTMSVDERVSATMWGPTRKTMPGYRHDWIEDEKVVAVSRCRHGGSAGKDGYQKLYAG